MENFKLRNGVLIPSIGFGTWQAPNDEIAVNSVKAAIAAGYRHIDTAAVYQNETKVGQGIRESGVDRSKIFVTSKVWNTERGYSRTLKAFHKSLTDLRLDYLDLYLIHWPATVNQFDNWRTINNDTWRAMEELYNQGRIRAIGVSNFMPHHLMPLMEKAHILPAINQIEYHPGFMQKECVKFCKSYQIGVEAWSPLGTGKMLDNPQLKKIAEKYQKSVAQICIKWVLQHDILPLPKSVTSSRIKENFDVDSFSISAEDMQSIDKMEYFGGSGLDPDKVEF